jgi:hypothetical protein
MPGWHGHRQQGIGVIGPIGASRAIGIGFHLFYQTYDPYEPYASSAPAGAVLVSAYVAAPHLPAAS